MPGSVTHSSSSVTQRNMAFCSNSISFLFLTCLIGFCQAACFSIRCDSQGQFHDCIQGQWICEPDEFCEVTTHEHGHGQLGITMKCRDIELLAECQTRSRRNSLWCDVHTHLDTCHWCCRDRECMLLLEMDIFSVEETTAAATTNTGNSATTITTYHQPTPTVTNTPTAATTQASTTTSETTTSKTLSPETKPPETTLVSTETTSVPTTTSTDTAPVTTTATAETTIGANCQDRYLGDCERDFGDQCDDKNIRIMCSLTCKACP